MSVVANNFLLQGYSPVIAYKANSQVIPVIPITVAYHWDAATYLIGWTNNDGRKLKANYFLLWEAVKDLQTREIEWFDFKGIDAEAHPGITGFKSGYPGEIYSLVAPPGSFNI